jgi:hypothetical protein
MFTNVQADQFYRLFPSDIWNYVCHLYLPDPMLSARLYAIQRARLMSLCRGSRVRWTLLLSECFRMVIFQTLIHFEPLFWSSISVDTSTCLHALRIALDRVPGPCLLRIQFSLCDVPWDDVRGTPSKVYSQIDRLLDLLLPTSHRWQAFRIYTFHPALYHHVQLACADVSADALDELALDYVYMPGYSLLDISSMDDYDLPFVPSIWFCDRYPSPRIMAVFATQLHWHRVGLFDSLVDLELVHISMGPFLNWLVFQELFKVAGRLENIRIDHLFPFDLPDDGILESSSVLRLDVGFPDRASSSHMADFLLRLRFPNLRTLLARSYMWTDLGQLVRPKHLLSNVRTFSMFGLCRDYNGVQALFACLSLVSVLDLTETRGCAFRAFRDWSLHRTTIPTPLPVLPLQHLSVGRVEVASLISLLAIYTTHSPYSSTRMQRLDLYRPYESDKWCLDLFRGLVKDVRLLPAEFPEGMDPLPWSMHTSHSLFAS